MSLQRQNLIRPMNTPGFEMTAKGIGLWLGWKTLKVVYLLCAALPMALYIACLLVVAIERRSTIELPIIMTAMLHPTIAIPFGIFAEFIGKYLSTKIGKNGNHSFKVLQRLFTYSINVHLTVIAALSHFLYAIWIPLEIASNLNFANLPFDQCPCDELINYDIPCTNKETENSFQNIFLGVPIKPFLIAFMIVTISCHFIHSLLIIFPSPTSLVPFYLGHLENQEAKDEEKPKTEIMQKGKFATALLTLSILAGIIASPYYLFAGHLKDGNFWSLNLIAKRTNYILLIIIFFQKQFVKQLTILIAPFLSNMVITRTGLVLTLGEMTCLMVLNGALPTLTLLEISRVLENAKLVAQLVRKTTMY